MTGPARQFVVPDRWASRVASMMVARTARRRGFWLRLAAGFLVTIPMAQIGGRAWLVLSPAVAIVSLAVVHLRTRRSIAEALPPGSLTSTEAHGDRLVARNPRGSRVIRYDDVRRIDVRGDVVFIEMTTAPPLLVLPRALVPDDLLERPRNATSGSG